MSCFNSNDERTSRSETALGFGVFDHSQLHAVFCGGRGGIVAGVALIDIGQFRVFVGDFLRNFGQRLDLCAVLFVGLRHMQRQ